MAEKRRLTPDEWAQVRHRWEGDVRPGFAWLSEEIASAWNVALSRPALHKAAGQQQWVKSDTPSEPLKPASLPPASQPEVTPKVTPKGKQPTPKVTPPPVRKPPNSSDATPPEDDVTDIGEDGRPMPLQAGNTPPEPPDTPPGTGLEVGSAAKKWNWIAKPQALGRPSKYRAEYAEEIVRYFDIEPFETIVVDPDTGKTAEVPCKFPLLQAFAAKIGVSSQTIYNWAKEVDDDGNRVHPEFFDALARARDLQYALLVQGALAGAFDSRFASLAAKNLIQWADKVENAEEGAMPDRATLETNFVTRMLAAHERQAAVLRERGLMLADDTEIANVDTTGGTQA